MELSVLYMCKYSQSKFKANLKCVQVKQTHTVSLAFVLIVKKGQIVAKSNNKLSEINENNNKSCLKLDKLVSLLLLIMKLTL